MSANQEEYVINIYRIVFVFIQNIVQILLLYLTNNFILYLIIQVICTILNNVTLSIKADKKYKYIKEKNIIPLEKKEKKKIFSNVKSLVLYKVGSVILNGTDNIIISYFLGVVSVGLYSNYTMIIAAITSIIGQCLNSFTGSVGNLNAIGEKKQKEKILYQIFFISVLIFGFCAGAIFILINPFIKIWIGEQYVLSSLIVSAIVLHFYINGIQFAAYTYRNTMGLFNKGKFAPIIAAVINIVLSIILCQYFEMFGIFIATSISRLVTTTWVDPYLIYKYELDGKASTYAKKYIKYTLIVIINIAICYFILRLVPDTNILYLILKGMIYTIITGIIYFLFFFKEEEFKELKSKFFKILKRGNI